MLEAVVLLLFPTLMAYSAASDLLTMTLANWISVCLVLAFLVLGAALGLDARDILVGHLSCGAAVLAGTFALFAFGWIGGGDAKLAAATAVWVGWDHLADYGLEASVFGGLLTLGILALRRLPLPPALCGAAWIARLHDADSGVPYGIALAMAGLVLYPQTAIWSASV